MMSAAVTKKRKFADEESSSEIKRKVQELTETVDQAGTDIVKEIESVHSAILELHSVTKTTATFASEDIVDGIVTGIESTVNDLRCTADDASGRIAVAIEEKLDTTNENLKEISREVRNLSATIQAVYELMRVR